MNSNDPQEIRAEMAQTRAAMSVTIDALQERLDPQRLKEEATAKARETANHLKEQATEKVREATIGKIEHMTGEVMDNVKESASEARYGIADTIRHNPIPAALIGIGLTAMFFNHKPDRNGNGYRPSNGYNGNAQRPRSLPIYGGMQAAPVRTGSYGGTPLGGTPLPETDQNVVDQTKSAVQQVGRQAQDKAGDLTGQVKDTVQNLGDQAQDTAGNLAGQVKGTVQQVGSQAQDMAGQVKDTVQQVGSQAQDQVEEFSGYVQDQAQSFSTDIQGQAERVVEVFNRNLRENPLSLGIVAIALGAAAAMIIPSTPQENQLFGEKRDQVLEKAQAAAHDALGQAAEQAQKAVSSAS